MADGRILKHLLEVERDAAELDKRAVREAAGRLLEARAQLEQEERKALADAAVHWEGESRRYREALAEARKRELEAFRRQLERAPIDRQALERLARRLLEEPRR